MSGRRILAMARKEVIQILRDTRSLVVVLIMPVALMALFGYGVSLDIKHVPIYVLDREGSQQSQDLLKHFQASEYFDLAGTVDNYAEMIRAIDESRCRLGLVIPSDFSQQLAGGNAVAVQAIVDGTDDNTANVVLGYTEAVVRGYSAQVQLDWLTRQGRSQFAAPVSVEARTWYNENLESRAFIVPGVIAIVMAVIGTFLTSLTIAREWERGTMEQLISTPVSPMEIMLGKLIPYFGIGLFDTGLCAAMGVWIFDVPFRGRLSTLFASSALFLVVLLGLGYLISVITKVQLAASQFALVATFLPAFLLSGFLFPIEQMPAPIRLITRLTPARYYLTILKSVFLKGTGLYTLRWEMLALAIFAVVVGTLATFSFHKRLG